MAFQLSLVKGPVGCCFLFVSATAQPNAGGRLLPAFCLPVLAREVWFSVDRLRWNPPLFTVKKPVFRFIPFLILLFQFIRGQVAGPQVRGAAANTQPHQTTKGCQQVAVAELNLFTRTHGR